MQGALLTKSYTTGSTHNFYHYPARFPPAIARSIIETFSRPGDVLLDPFMGGGTTVVEALSLGRRIIGVDLNALAHFVATVRTTPLSSQDETTLISWAERASILMPREHLLHVPKSGA